MAFAVLLPVAAMAVFSTWVINRQMADYRHSAELLVAAQIAQVSQALAKELENERTLSIRFLQSDGKAHRLELDEQRRITDSRMDSFRAVIEMPEIAERLRQAEDAPSPAHLQRLRQAVDEGASPGAALFAYNRMTTGLRVQIGAPAPLDQSRLISAYLDLGAVKDRIARARALIGAGGLVNRQALAENMAETNAYMESFRGHASPEQLRIIDDTVRGDAVAQVERLHRQALNSPLTPADKQEWDQAHTALSALYVDAEHQLALVMEKAIGEQLSEARTTFFLALLAVSALVGLSLETMRRSERRAVRWEEEARKLFRAVEQSPVSIMISDPSGRIEYVNPAFTSMTGYTREEALGDTPRLLRSSETPAHVFKDMWSAISEGRDWRGELINRRKDGTKYWESMTVAPVKGADGHVENFIAVKQDVTARKQTEQAMAEAREAAELSNRAKTEFLATMSHELRTPLNAIIGFSEIIENELLGPVGEQQYKEYAHDINESGRHLLGLINDILDMARIEVGRFELNESVVDMNQLIRSTVLLAGERARNAGLRITEKLPPDLPHLRGDARRIKQTIANILSNAVKFTASGGHVSVSAVVEANGLAVRVYDTGIGINAEDMTKIMAPFGQVESSLSRRYEGAGLGLPLSRRFMEMHGGELSLDSIPGKGTTATLLFPLDRLIDAPIQPDSQGTIF